jgi:DeoR family glycerol-3-phosphate regulon repressor
MTLNPRQTALLEEVRNQGFASIEELARKFGVTLQTVRRDVNLLAEHGMLARFHGGARVEGSTIENIAYRHRQLLNAESKANIARAVASAVPDGCSLILNIGTTIEEVARALLHHRGLRVITNNLNVANILADNPIARSSWPAACCARETAASWARPPWTSSASSRWTSG